MGRTAYGIKQRLSGIRFLLAAPGGEGSALGWRAHHERRSGDTDDAVLAQKAYLESNRRAPSSGWFCMLRASEYILAVDLLSVSFRVWRER